MTETLPRRIHEFLTESGWAVPDIEALPGDASFRRYFRLRGKGKAALLMDAPPPQEDVGPFLHVAHWLNERGMRAPKIYAQCDERGLVLLEDFGLDRMRDWLDEHPADEKRVYSEAIDALVALHRCEPGPFAPYDMEVYLREVALLPEWFCPQVGIEVDAEGFSAAWREVLTPLLERQEPGVTVLRDYHAENIMLLPDGSQGLIDFQDALVGHPAYDLVSLLQDARRDVSEELEAAMLEHYCQKAGCDEHFAADYARLGAQRNAKIVGIFARLNQRDGKPRYLSMIPRVWEAMERDLAHPALAPVARWFDANIPDEIRASKGSLTS